MKGAQSLRWALNAGGFYFLGISLCHWFGWKIPGFYIYFNVPSTAYQDWIISILAFGWFVFLYIAGLQLPGQTLLVRGILIAGFVALVGLARVNLFTDFGNFGLNHGVGIYWLEVGALIVYLATIFILFWRLTKRGVVSNG